MATINYKIFATTNVSKENPNLFGFMPAISNSLNDT